MPLILRCDHPGCVKEAPGSWLPSGRLERPDGWWVMPGEPVVIACCTEHVPGLVPPVVQPVEKERP